MKLGIIVLIIGFTSASFAQKVFNMSFNNEELTKIIETYAKNTGQKFIVDPAVRGKITISLPEAVAQEEAFHHLSSALAINGYAISVQGDTMVIKAARNIQRDLIEVSSNRPNLKPERMYSWVYSPKNFMADALVREVRMLNSKDGEITAFSDTNKIIITDWAANINRVIDLINELDKPVSPEMRKKIGENKKNKMAQNQKKVEVENHPSIANSESTEK